MLEMPVKLFFYREAILLEYRRFEEMAFLTDAVV